MKIANKINISFFILIATGLALALVVCYLAVKKELTAALENELVILVREKKSHVETYLSLLKSSTNQLSKSPTLEDFLRILSSNSVDTSGAFESAMRRLTGTKEVNPAIFEFVLLDAKGKVAASTGPTPLGSDESWEPYFANAKDGTYIKDAYLSKTEAMPLLAIGAPIYGHNTGQFLGVLVSRAKLDDLDDIVTSSIEPKSAIETYVANKQGYIITSLKHLPQAFLRVKVDTFNWHRCLAAARKDKDAALVQKEIVSAQNYQGKEVLGVMAFIPEMQWCLLVEIEPGKAYAALRTVQRAFSAIFVLLNATAWLIGTFISRFVTKPLATLKKGMEIARNGDFNFKLGAVSNDEIGELSRAFDQMTSSLASSTTSIDNLQQEIEKRKGIERRLREEEATLRAITDSAQDAILMMNADGLISYYNMAAERILGWSRQEALGRNLHQFLSPERFHEAHKKAFPYFQETGQGAAVGKTLELAALRKDKTEIPIELSMTSLQIGGSWHAVGIMRDISERKRAEQEIVNAQKKYRQLFESTSEGLYSADLNGRITSCNEAFKKMMECKETKCVTPCYQEITPEKWRVKETEVFETQLFVQGYTDLYEKEFLRKNGSVFPAAVRAFLIKDESGQATGFWALVRDLTAAKRMEANQRQADRIQAIGALAAGIAHEINTPAQFVSDNLSFLKNSSASLIELLNKCADLRRQVLDKSDTDDTVVQISDLCEKLDIDFVRTEFPAAITESLNGIGRISEIVRAMKSFAHPGSEEKKPTDINKAIQDTVTVARNEWKYVAEMELNLSPDLPLVPCLLGDFNQVILNLIVNAAYAIGEVLKAAPEKGQKGKITINTAAEKEAVIIKIADSGSGIPEAIRGRVFDPFFTTKPVGKGSGQGLAIAHSVIVEKHGGSISFDSEEGKGTIFTIRLPLKIQQSNGKQNEPKRTH